MQRSAQAAPERVGLRRLAPPKSLAILLGIVVIVGLCWALLVPPWQSPDEISHYAYAESLAAGFTLPGKPARPEISSDQTLADGSVGSNRGAFYPQSAPPNWSRADWAEYLARERLDPPSRTDGAGLNSADYNPPLYYLLASVGYLIDNGGTAFGRLYAMQIEGVLLLVVTTIGGWLLAGEVFGRRRLPQLACAAVAGLLPMTTFMSTSVNPDALLIALWTLALWLGARVINHRARGWDAAALCAVTAAAILTKATSYALVIPVLLALLAGWLRRPAAERGPALKRLAAAGLALVVPVLGWLVYAHTSSRPAINQIATSTPSASSSAATPAHGFNLRQFISYVWQFYLPRLPFLTPFRTTPGLPVYDIWVRQGIGMFGWLDVYLPAWLYNAAGVAAAGIGVTAVALLARLLKRRHLLLLGYFALTLLGLLALLHLGEYLVIIGGGGQFNQGRYLLPVVGLLGLAIALIVRALPPRVRPPACGLVLTGLLALQVISLSAVLQAYYL
jgi:4-amino-4-deoxy-L-arabinose transferase-like glycosyltransferase